MLLPLDEASKVFCVPVGHLLKRLAVKDFNVTVKEGVRYAEYMQIAEALRCPVEIATLLSEGKEWLFDERMVEELYGCNIREARNIAGGPVFVPSPFPGVYRVTPFVNWLKNADPADRIRMKEGKNAVEGPTPKVPSAGSRGQVRSPHQDNRSGSIGKPSRK